MARRTRRQTPDADGSISKPKGRPKGALGRRTKLTMALAAKGGELPLDFMLRVMRNRRFSVLVRLDAAYKAAPYVHQRLAPVDASQKEGTRVEVSGGLPMVEYKTLDLKADEVQELEEGEGFEGKIEDDE